MNSNIIKRYKTWFDTRNGRLVTYNCHWTKEDWESLKYVGELQPNQNGYMITSDGYIYRILYGKPAFYYHATPGGLHSCHLDGTIQEKRDSWYFRCH